MTIMVKSSGVMRPRSRPMFRMMSSMSPRAFINDPIASASRCECPLTRAAAQHATPLPTDVITQIPTAIRMSAGVLSRPMRVFSPE